MNSRPTRPRPGAFGECPSCHDQTFTVSRRDPRVAQCFGASCDIRRVLEPQDDPVENLLFDVYADFHRAVNTSDATGVSEWLQKHGVHGMVATHSMMGVVPPDYDLGQRFASAVQRASDHLIELQRRKPGRPTNAYRKEVEAAEQVPQRLEELRRELRLCVGEFAGGVVFLLYRRPAQGDWIAGSFARWHPRRLDRRSGCPGSLQPWAVRASPAARGSIPTP
jgi:hypothetical protein